MSGTDVPVEVEAKVCANWGQNRLVGKQEQETDFLARDREEAVANKPTEEQCGKSVIDLSRDIRPQSAPADPKSPPCGTNVASFLFTLSTPGN